MKTINLCVYLLLPGSILLTDGAIETVGTCTSGSDIVSGVGSSVAGSTSGAVAGAGSSSLGCGCGGGVTKKKPTKPTSKYITIINKNNL